MHRMLRSLAFFGQTHRIVRSATRSFCTDMKKPGDGIGRVVVIGGGSLGSLFSGRIATIKAMKDRVWLLTQWQEHLTAMSEMKGIVVKEGETAGADTMIGRVRPADSAKYITSTRSDFAHIDPGRFQTVVFLAVKQGQIRGAAEQAATILHELGGGLCVTLLNGMGHIDVVQSAFKYHDVRAQVVHGLFYGGAHMPGPGMVVHAGKGHLELGFTRHPDLITATLLQDLCELLRLAGIDTVVNSNITAVSARKLTPWPSPLSQVACFEWVLAVAQGTAANKSSMLKDVLAGKRTEVEAINGFVVSEGRRLGVQVPVNEALLLLVQAMQDINVDEVVSE